MTINCQSIRRICDLFCKCLENLFFFMYKKSFCSLSTISSVYVVITRKNISYITQKIQKACVLFGFFRFFILKMIFCQYIFFLKYQIIIFCTKNTKNYVVKTKRDFFSSDFLFTIMTYIFQYIWFLLQVNFLYFVYF